MNTLPEAGWRRVGVVGTYLPIDRLTVKELRKRHERVCIIVKSCVIVKLGLPTY